MLKLGLVGKSISHSKSQEMYEGILNTPISYQLLDYTSEANIPSLNEIFENVQGLSITSPYKTYFINDVIMEKEINEIGAVNCISKKDDLYYATNTDYLALKEIIDKKYKSKNIIILGDGVMGKVTMKVLRELSIPFTPLSRQIDGDLNKVKLSGTNLLVINTCSRSFEFKNILPKGAIFWDYNYSFNPHRNYFKDLEAIYIDGLEMLHLQAKYALKFWNIPY